MGDKAAVAEIFFCLLLLLVNGVRRNDFEIDY